jgi:hypothetical protein
VAILILGAGCESLPLGKPVPSGKFDLLAESSHRILKGTTETYTRIEKLQRLFVVVTAGDGPLTEDSFKPAIDGQSFDIVPELRYREKALEVIVAYSRVLQAFAKEDFEGGVDRATERLAGSLKSFSAATAPNLDLAVKASGLMATVVNVIGRHMVQRKRIQALKEVMDSGQEPLGDLANLIKGSNDKIKRHVNVMFRIILAHANRVRPSPKKGIERVRFDSQTALTVAEVNDIQGSLDAFSDAVTKVPPAHLEIRQMLDDKLKLIPALQQLGEEGKRINKFYRSVK